MAARNVYASSGGTINTAVYWGMVGGMHRAADHTEGMFTLIHTIHAVLSKIAQTGRNQ